MSNPPSVFISYRRETSVDLAQRIRDDLEKYKLNVFLDLERLSGGERWKARLQRELVNCDFLLVILAPQTLESEWVRYEIKTALDQNKVIVPVTHHGFTFSEGAVPPEIAGLSDFNAIPFVDRYQKASLEEIREALGIRTDDLPTAVSPDLATAAPSTKAINLQLVIAIIGLVGVIGAALIGILPKLIELSSPTPTPPPTQVLAAASATTALSVTPTDASTLTPEPSLTPLPPSATLSPTSEPTLTPLPPSPTDAPAPIPPSPLPPVSINVPTVVLPDTTILVTAWQNAHCIFTPDDGSIPFGFDTSTGNIQYSVKHKAGNTVSIICEDAQGRHEENQFVVSTALIPVETLTAKVTNTLALSSASSFTPTITAKKNLCDAVIVSKGNATVINVIRSQPYVNAPTQQSIAVGQSVLIRQKTSDRNQNIWYELLSLENKVLGWIPSEYISLSTTCQP